MKYTPDTVGKLLSNWESIGNVELAHNHGFFSTLEGYWFWLKSKDERFRKTPGWQSKKLAKELKIDGDLDDQGKAYFKEATWAKLLSQCVLITQEHKDLPIVHYYNYSGKIIPAGPKWWVDYLQYAVPKVVELMSPILKELENRGWKDWYNRNYLINVEKGINDRNGLHPVFAAIKEGLITAEILIQYE